MDKFTKIRNIGKGNMGACALARNNEDGKYYVIKQVDLTRMSKKERQQSLNEARVLSSLRHPNIINYVDSFLARKSDHLCIVMEFADGGDLSSRIKKNYGVNFRESQILDWFIQIVLSLNYVHQRKILHRDVKTQNVFLTSDGQVKLGDFGIARTLSSTYDQAKTFVGTPYYLSPELILERPYDHRSDVWAIGVVLYELLTLKHPFNASDMKGLMQRILKVQYDPIPTIYSAEIRNLIPKLLVKDPSRRIRLSEILELPIVNKRLIDWLSCDTLPKKYVDTLVAQNLLPEAVIAATKGSESPPPTHVAAVDSPPNAFSAGNDTVKRKVLPPLQPLQFAHPSLQPSLPISASLPFLKGSGTTAEVSKYGTSTSPTKTEESFGSEVSSELHSSLAASAQTKIPPEKTSGSKATPSNSKAAGLKPLLRLNDKPVRPPVMYKYYKNPRSPQKFSVVPPQGSSDNGGLRVLPQENFYAKPNYFQKAENRDLYRHFAPAGQCLNSSLPSLRRNVGRMENGQAAAHLHPLFHVHNNLVSGGRDGSSRQSEIRAILQRAAARRKMGA